MLVGVLNILGSLQDGVGFWMVFGGMQIYWGFQEMAKFSLYGRQSEEATLAIEDNVVNLESNTEAKQYGG